jgi:hypothetical protein
MWKRGEVDFVQTQQLAWERVPDGLFCAGETRKVLSADPEQGACTWLVQLRNAQEGTLPAGADVYVLAGAGTLNGIALEPDGYVFLPQGARFTLVPDIGPLVLYVAFFGEPEVATEVGTDDAVAVGTADGTWVSPTWTEGDTLSFGAFVKVLRSDSLGEAYVTFMRPGWSSPLEEKHPNYEESFRVYGDLLQGARGLMHAGAYSFRGPGIWHAPLYTRTGTMSFIRTSGPTVTEYREPAGERTCAALVARTYRQFPAPSVS